MENEKDKMRLIEEMEKVGITGLDMNMKVDEIVKVYKDWKAKQEEKRVNKISRKSCLDRIRASKNKTKVTERKGVLIAPDTYLEIYEDEIEYCRVDDNKFIVCFKEGGKYFYNIKTSNRIK